MDRLCRDAGVTKVVHRVAEKVVPAFCNVHWMWAAKEVGALLEDRFAVRASMLFQGIVSMCFVAGGQPVNGVFWELLARSVELAVEKSVKQFPRDEFPFSGCPVEFAFEVLPAAVSGEFFVQWSVERGADKLVGCGRAC